METGISGGSTLDQNARRWPAKFLKEIKGNNFSLATRLLPVWVALVLGAGVIYSILRGDRPSHLFKEGRLFTQLSGQMLVLAGLVNLHIFRLRRIKSANCTGKPQDRFIWLVMGFSFLYLFLDEVACFHEKIGDLIQYYTPVTQGFMEERFDSLVVGAYGIFAVGILSLFRREILNFVQYWPCYFWGGIFFCLMVICDFFTEDKMILQWIFHQEAMVEKGFVFLEMLEDYCKILAISFFLRGVFTIRHDLIQGKLRSRPGI